MTDWLLVLTLLSVAAVLACFRFAGCALIYNFDDYKEKLKYDAAILKETKLLAYWRLGEPSGTVAGNFPATGDTANDEVGRTPFNQIGNHPGTYQQIEILLPADDPSQSPSTAAPMFDPGLQPGLLLGDPDARSVQVNGGFVSVPFSDTFNPDTAFSVEAWVNPKWDKDEAKVFRCVVASRQDTGLDLPKFGYIIYAGPSTLDPMKQDDHMYWQVWVGDGTKFWQTLVMDEPLTREPTYLLITYDGATTITLDVFPNSAKTSTRKTMQAAYKKITDTTIPLFIGMGTPEPALTPRYPFNGRLQEIAFYGKALMTEQVTKHVEAAKGE